MTLPIKKADQNDRISDLPSNVIDGILGNKKADQNDRISDLPSNVIDGILGNLKIQDQVRTSILSKKWRYMWTSAPRLYFDDDFIEMFLDLDDPNDIISDIITDVLMFHNGPIYNFSLCIWDDFDIGINTENINLWIPFMSRDIKHLELFNYCALEDEMPDILFSCKELIYFKFSSFHLSTPPNFCGFKKLLELHLLMVTFDSASLESLMSGCPFLEKLTIVESVGSDYLVITSPSLKVLVLTLIDTKSICLKKANNLVDFTLTTYVGKSFIKSLPKIKRFSLAACEKYEDTIPPMLRKSSFSSLEYLNFKCLNLKKTGQLLSIVSILKTVPSLVKLEIKIFTDVNTAQMTDHSKELECCSCFPKLQTVIICVQASSQQHTLSLTKFILANSPSLKTLTFNCLNKLDASMIEISQELFRMERASPRAHVDFLHTSFNSSHD